MIYMTGPYKYDDLPQVFKDNMKNIENTCKDLVEYYDDEMCEEFVREHFPEALEVYNSLFPGAYKSDVWRVMILLKFGGTYMDMGFQVVSPLENYKEFDFVSVIDGNPQSIYQAFMYSKPNCLVLKMVYEMILHNLKNQLYGISPLSVTGPYLVGEAFMLLNSIQVMDREFYEAHGEKYKLLRHEPQLVKTFDGKLLFKTKFDGYYEAIYQKKDRLDNEHYSHYWNQRQIYKLPEILILSLPGSPRREKIYNFPFKFFDGVLIKTKEDMEKICSEFGIDSKIIHPNKKFGSLGCSFGHLSVMKYIVDNNIPRLLYFEDDVILTDDIKIPQNIEYDILFVHKHAKDGWGAEGQVVSLQGAKKYLNNAENILSSEHLHDLILLIPSLNNTGINVQISDYIFCEQPENYELSERLKINSSLKT